MKKWTLMVAASAVWSAAGCGSFSPDCTTTIQPSDDPEANRQTITAALVEPSDGDVICLREGTYRLSSQLTLNASGVANVEIRGESQDGTILDFAGQTEGGNGILVDGINDFRASNFTIKNTAGDGIKVQNANGVELVDLTVTWDGGPDTDNGAYGIYPVLAQNVLVEGNKVSHASDAGIYLGQSNTAIVRNNEAFANVAGLEIENTSNADVHSNELYDNTGGLLVFDLPNLQVKDGSQNKIHDNTIRNNNRDNFAESGTIVSIVPKGTGILLLATDRNDVHDNTIENHQSVGLAIISYGLVEAFQSNNAAADEDYDPYSEANYIHANLFANNGEDPADIALGLSGGNALADMIIEGAVNPSLPDGTTLLDVRHCFSGNVRDGGDPAPFQHLGSDPDAHAAPTNCSDDWRDFCHYECNGEAVAAVSLQ